MDKLQHRLNRVASILLLFAAMPPIAQDPGDAPGAQANNPFANMTALKSIVGIIPSERPGYISACPVF